MATGRTQQLVWLAAGGAILTRIPGLTTPPRPDESGFTLVARSWHPTAHSVYGFFWVDRPPEALAVVKLSDAIGGIYAIRVLGAICVGLLVLLAAQIGRQLADRLDADADRLARWAALAALVTVGSSWIDPGVTKGEVLALPLTLGAIWAALAFVGTPKWWLPLMSGLLAGLGFGLKQSLLDGAVFCGVLLLASLGRRSLKPLALLLAGAVIPIAATIVWALAVGLNLGELAYVVIGFRLDASRVLAAYPGGPDNGGARLWLTLLTTCLFVVPLLLLACLRPFWRRDRALAAAVTALLVWEYVAMVAGGSGWPTYLYGVIPGSVLVLTCTLALTQPWERLAKVATSIVALSCAVSLIGWVIGTASGAGPPPAAYVGLAIKGSSQPGDTIVAYGSRADIVYESGLTTPYRYLWTLPMRVLDPQLDGLKSVLSGPSAPTWFVETIPLTSWGITQGAEVQQVVAQRYQLVGQACGWPVYLLAGQTRPALVTGDCTRPWRF